MRAVLVFIFLSGTAYWALSTPNEKHIEPEEVETGTMTIFEVPIDVRENYWKQVASRHELVRNQSPRVKSLIKGWLLNVNTPEIHSFFSSAHRVKNFKAVLKDVCEDPRTDIGVCAFYLLRHWAETNSHFTSTGYERFISAKLPADLRFYNKKNNLTQDEQKWYVAVMYSLIEDEEYQRELIRTFPNVSDEDLGERIYFFVQAGFDLRDEEVMAKYSGDDSATY